jgi:hypothetical protein
MNVLSSMVNQFTSAFDNALNQTKNNNDLIVGENGSLAHETPAQTELDFDGLLCEYFLLMRSSTEEDVKNILNRQLGVLESNLLSSEKRKENLIKLLKVSLFIRNPRKGKGEKQIFYYIIEHLYSLDGDYQKMAKTILDLIGEFGYYKDYNNIYMKTQINDIKSYIIDKYVEQLSEDVNKQNTSELSLCAKWAPRECSTYSEMAKVLAQKLISKINPKNTDMKGQLKQYRQYLSQLNKKLNTVQTYMCQKHWGDIDFKNVSSVSMTNLSKAFQDEKVNSFPKSQRKVNITKSCRNRRVAIKVQDNRRHHEGDADYEDREKCRQNLINHISSGGKVNSSVTNLSQIIQQYLNGTNIDITWEAQWTSRVTELQNMISQLRSPLDGEPNRSSVLRSPLDGEPDRSSVLPDKPSIFPMVDLSSSMSGDPMINAITLGLFTSMILDNPLDQDEFCFANRFMSFASEPALVKLPRFSTLDNTKPASLKEKVEIMKEWTNGGRWGGSTNIHKAIDLLLKIALDNKVPEKDMPKILAIFSDMQFDQGDFTWTKTSYDNISDKFTKAGYQVPHVLFWNLRANAVGFQVKANTPNSSMLSGYSTRMLDLFLSGNVNEMQNELSNKEEEEDTDNKLENNSTITLLNKALEHDMFEKYNDMFNNLF